MKLKTKTLQLYSFNMDGFKKYARLEWANPGTEALQLFKSLLVVFIISLTE